MCGLFGFAGPSGVNVEHLAKIARQAARRGPHAWGVAWAALDGEALRAHKEPQALATSRWSFSALEGARLVVGHCRLSTSGPPDDNLNNQPIVLERVAVAHNGNVRNHAQHAARRGIALRTRCDSELLAHFAGDSEALRTALGAEPFAVILFDGGKLRAMRHQHPLFVEQTAEGVYLGSRRWENASLLGDDQMVEIGP